ncbi:ribosomal protein S18-alanine N-acetyltransferase [Shewanella sp. Isolate11]|uniref:ribosomal protein S18-alanine N-acetyltransferase n=1 Tax=Shewanella sp. Isolate11 TaxID=2908530 RepID=UPI001EFCE377|nr:ribosomal protein S18-alanine N-acetyltransferase [Shewanella sp. Isolate11]MCG9697428.1 ribosomal protein S18-alanine N-acetyltransferase [Shewanella sp. Isolate11]
MKQQIKELSLNEVSEVFEIEQACHLFPMSLANVESCFGRFYRVVGFFEDNQLFGFAILHQLFEDATLMDICVHPTKQGKGIGQALMQTIIDIAATEGAERIMLEVRISSQRAIELYRHFGFEQTGIREAYYKLEQGKEDAVLMQRLL